MVVSRSDSKRRKKGDVNSLQESPKRTKVHAQRKFAQGSHLNSPVLTPVKDKDKIKFNGTTQTTELLPVKRPKTEEFVNFLCFRGSDLLPKALEFFNEPSVFEPKSNDTRRDSSSGTSKGTSRAVEKHSDQAGCVAKAEAKNKSKPKAIAAVQALKKKYQEQRLAKEKRSLTKLALKVKEKNVMRTRSAGPLEETPITSTGKKPVSAKNSRLGKTKIVAAPKPVLRKQATTPIKRMVPKATTRGGLRSGGELPPGSDVGLKTERKTRKITKFKPTAIVKKLKKTMIASSLSDFSSDDEQPLLKRPKSASVALAQRITTRSRLTAKTAISKSQRPTRRTKEAATIFMEMLGKDLRSPDEEDDTVDSMSVESFIELPNSKQTERREKEFKDLAEKNKLEEKKKLKLTKKGNQSVPKKNEKNNKKLPNKTSVVLNSIKSRSLRRNSHRLRSKEIELKRLQANRKSRLMNRVLSKSSTKEEHSRDEKMEASSSIVISSAKKREKKSVPVSLSKKNENKVKNQKVNDIDNTPQSAKPVKQKKDTGTVFNDSDEEPLGHKINQVTELPVLKCARKNKLTSDKEGTLSTKSSDVCDQKPNRRKAATVGQEVSKDTPQAPNRRQHSKEAKNSLSSISSELDSDKQHSDTKKLAKPKSEHCRSESVKDHIQDLQTKPTSAKKVVSKVKVNVDRELVEEGFNDQSDKKKVTKSKTEEKEDSISNVQKKKNQVSKRVLKRNESEQTTNDKKLMKLQSKTDCNQDTHKSEQKKLKSQKIDQFEDKVKDNTLGSNSDSTVVASKDVNTKINQELAYSNTSIENEKRPIKHDLSDQKSDIVNVIDSKVSNALVSDSSNLIHCDKTVKKENKEISSQEICKDKCSTAAKESVVKIKPNESSAPFVTSLVKVESALVSNQVDSLENTKSQDLKYKQFNMQPKMKLNLDKEHPKASKNALDSDNKIYDINIDKANKLSSDCKSVCSTDVNMALLAVPKEKHATEDKIILSDSLNSNKCENLMGKNIPSSEIESSNKTRLNLDISEPKCIRLQTDNLVSEKDKLIIPIIDNHSLKSHKNDTKRTTDNLNPASNKTIFQLNKVNDCAESGHAEMLISSQIQSSDSLLQETPSQLGSDVKNVSTSYNEQFEKLIVENEPDDKRGLFETCNESGKIFDSNINVELKDDRGDDKEIKGQQTVQQPKGTLFDNLDCTSGKSELKQADKTPTVDKLSAQRKNPVNQQLLASIKPKEDIYDKAKEYSEFVGNGIKYNLQAKDFEQKLYLKEERFIGCNTKLDNLEMSDKISSAVDSLMSLKNVQKLEDKSYSTVGNRLKNANNSEIEVKQKTTQDYDSKHFLPVESKHADSHEFMKLQFQDLNRHVTVQEVDVKQSMIQEADLKHSTVREPENKRVAIQEPDTKRITYMSHELDPKRMTVQDSDIKRVTMQEPDIKRGILHEPDVKRVTIQEPDMKRCLNQEGDTKRVQIQDLKPKQSHVLKGCPNPKSMLKPGTLIDIAGISHSPEIMTPLRPGSDGEIIPMNKPIYNDMSFTHKGTAKAYEPRTENNFFGYNRWQSLSPEKNNVKPDPVTEKETLDLKSRLPVNESAWRQAFKNVREPKSSNNSPVEKPAARKQLSVTALAKRHSKSKSEAAPTPFQSAIPFLRQNKPFLGTGSPNKSKQQNEMPSNSSSDVKKNTDIDLNSLREKEAEVEEFLRQFVSGSVSRTSIPVAAVQGGMEHVNEKNVSCDAAVSNFNRSTNFNLPEAKKCQNSTQIEQGCENAASKQPTMSMNKQVFKQSTLEHSDVSLFAVTNTKRSNSPSDKFSVSEGLSDAAKNTRVNISNVSSSLQDLNSKKVNTSNDSSKEEHTLNIFQDSSKRSISPKLLYQKPPETVQDGGSNKLSQMAFQFCISSSKNVCREDASKTSTVASPQIHTNDNIFKQIQPGRRLNSPTRSSPFTNSGTDNLFKDCGSTKRTKSPTLSNTYSHRNSPIGSPQTRSPKRNSNSPIQFTTSIFKESVPARSYSPTSSSAFPNESDSISNVFSQNMGFKRSISPLCNKPDFLLANSVPKIENIDMKMSNATNLKRIESYSEDSSIKTSYCQSKTIKSETLIQNVEVPKSVEPNQSIKTEMLTQRMEVPKSDDQNRNKVTITALSQVSGKQSMKNSNSIKKEATTFENLPLNIAMDVYKQEKLNKNVTSGLDVIDSQANTPSNNNTDKDDSKLSTFGTSEAKHRLPLAVEQTLKKLSQVRSSSNKKTPNKTNEQVKVPVSNENKEVPDILISETIKDDSSSRRNIVPNKLSTGIYSHTQEGELDLMVKKKVNMSSEEIKRWLNDSSSPLMEHREGCGILENNVCECEYGNTVNINQPKIESPKQETFLKASDMQSKTLESLQFDQTSSNIKLDKDMKTTDCDKKIATLETYHVQHSYSSSFSDDKITITEVNNKTKNSVNKVSVSKLGGEFSNTKQQKDAVLLEKQGDENEDVKKVALLPLHLPNQSKCSDNDESQLELPTTPPVAKTKTFKLVQKNVDAEQEARLADISEVLLPHLRDDVSSSNDISSSNEETPEKSSHPERRSIFHQRRSALKVKERRELISPSVKAFSPENESSVYAFEPDLPPASTPFRRSKGKEGRSTNTTTDEDELTPSSNSIAVQVNFDNEAVLECSTQTDVQEGDDDDMHTFYIPLQQSSADTTKPPLIQGVAVKLDTEGPDQKVIMRAKLVTKPLSTFSRTSTTPARALIGARSGKPEQKVRPLSVKPPVGTVQPTARPKPSPQAEPATPSTSKTCSPQAARLAKRSKAKGASSSTSSVDSHSTKAPPPSKVPPANLVEAPTFYPTEKEFEDPLEYIDSITPQAEKYGLCRVVPPSNFKPECKVSDDMRFTAYNQYIHKMLHRWGPNVKEMLAIKKYLATQSIALTHPPWIGGMEVDLPRLYQTVQQCGGLKEVIEKKRWHRVADAMKIPKSAQDRVTKLDDIYCKFLLPYDTLSHVERTQLFEEVEKDWIEREKRVANSQEDDDDEDSDSDSDIDECIVKGRSMALNAFYRIARNTMSMWFSKTDNPPAADVELEFWRHVASRQHHVCVHSGSIDTGAVGYGFPIGKNSSTSRHPWNLKVLTNNPGSILRFLSPVIGVTVPTLHVGMLFSACCWYRDPHGLPWIEYLHTGANKIWYGIPDSSSEQFRSAVMDLVPRLSCDKKIWLASDTAMVPPPLLVERGVSLSRIVQEPGQFIIVFPKAFTSSICTGYVVSESVYFAQPSWLATAQNLFNDMRESCEPTVFSLEKLLFSIVNDSRSSIEVLNQILPIVVSLRDGEIAGRRQLEELGLNSSEQLNTNKRRKNRPTNEEDEDYECDECRTNLFISFVSNSHDSSVYCLPHAVELLTHKRSQVKHCSLLYAFSEDELEDLVEKLKSRVENKNQKKVQTKSIKS